MINKLYYINLDKRTDRLEHLEKNVLPFINFKHIEKERISAVDHTRYQHISQRGAGCSLSHLKIWKDAIEKGYKKIIVMEDDFELLEPNNRINDFIEKLETMEFSICNFAYNNMKPLLKTEFEGFYRCNNLQTTSCYVANVEFLKTMIPVIEQATERLMRCESYHVNAIDQVWKKFQNRKDWLVTERLGKQRGSMSDIEKRNTNYGV